MTLETVLVWSIGRSLTIAAIAMPLSFCVWQLLGCWPSDRRPFSLAEETKAEGRFTGPQQLLLVTAALLPLFIPDLLTGFSYRLTAAYLIHSAAATECLYGALLLFKVVALQVAVRLILPASAMTSESLHSWKLLSDGSVSWWRSWVTMLLLGPGRSPLIGYLSGVLLCFQEFETAALLQIDRHPITFTVWLFDAHAAGEPLTRSLQFVGRSALFQSLLLLPVVVLLNAGQRHNTAAFRRQSSALTENRKGRATGAIVIAVSLACLLVWPVWSNANSVRKGLTGLASQRALGSRLQQILFSLLTASAAAGLSLILSVRLRRVRSRLGVLAILLPCLCGPLTLSLVLLATFQLPLFHALYDTWVPMIAGSTLLLLPRAFLLAFLLEVFAAQTGEHAARLLTAGSRENLRTGRQLLWQLRQRRWLLAMAVLTHWSFWDVTVASILRPVRFEPVVTRLYNEMHYGRTESLVAITSLALLIPLATFIAVALVFHVRAQR